jgi:hypothetical protein
VSPPGGARHQDEVRQAARIVSGSAHDSKLNPDFRVALIAYQNIRRMELIFRLNFGRGRLRLGPIHLFRISHHEREPNRPYYQDDTRYHEGRDERAR